MRPNIWQERNIVEEAGTFSQCRIHIFHLTPGFAWENFFTIVSFLSKWWNNHLIYM